MKVNLECGNDFRNGYVNILFNPNPQLKPHKDIEIAIGNFRNLDPIIDDDSIEELIFNPPLNMLSPGEMQKIISHWYQKLKKDAIIKLSFINIRKVGLAAHSGMLTLENIHFLTLGPQNQFRTVLDIAIIKALLDTSKLSLEIMNISDFLVTLEAKK